MDNNDDLYELDRLAEQRSMKGGTVRKSSKWSNIGAKKFMSGKIPKWKRQLTQWNKWNKKRRPSK